MRSRAHARIIMMSNVLLFLAVPTSARKTMTDLHETKAARFVVGEKVYWAYLHNHNASRPATYEHE